MVLMSSRDTDVENRLADTVGEGEGGMNGENSMETFTLSYVKQISFFLFFFFLLYDTGNSTPCSVTI